MIKNTVFCDHCKHEITNTKKALSVRSYYATFNNSKCSVTVEEFDINTERHLCNEDCASEFVKLWYRNYQERKLPVQCVIA